MTNLPKIIQEWPHQWRRVFRRTTKAEMLNGNTFEEAIAVAEATCRLEFAIQRLTEPEHSQNSVAS
ncbi:MAG: hypothetical protein ACI97A_001225 [Planctomycetota bacterium]|jgi:hypothetical protein